MLYLWDWPESCVICSVGDRDRHQKCIVPLSAHLGPDIFAAFCLESPVYNSLAQTNEESAVAVVWIFYNLALSVFPLFHFLQLLPIVDPFEFRFQFFAASLKLFIFFPSTPNFFFLGNWPLPNQQSLNLKVVFRFYSDDDHGEWDDDDDGPWNFIKGSTFCWYTMIVLGDGFVQLQAGSWRRGISEFWPKLENLQLVQNNSSASPKEEEDDDAADDVPDSMALASGQVSAVLSGAGQGNSTNVFFNHRSLHSNNFHK